MGQDLVEIHPRELQFTFEVKKQSSCTVHLVNKSNEYVAFKVKTTSPKRYCVRPNTGVILPRKTCDFTVTMQALRTAPPDMQLKDKFLVQTTVVPYGTSDENLIPAFFSKETGRYIEESKLRVVLVSAPDPLEEQQPVNGFHSTEPAIEVSVTEDVQNLKSKVNNLESKLEQAEKMIIKLREESRTTTQERDKLQQEMLD
ncbi:hypothetical protein PR202_gb03824 [Eleusine coracana subsp. coracana]|uniref:MSP domain-containing protein n=1 Tax=Eleusine coracana subsp. coracana TaxID=191504 RepID=A0AAV5E1Y2_ELECO|nr:hypothetical protein PR202_gb03824 [Eleusine coracana subsp. coracana]